MMAGGGVTLLWPLSRAARPKQFRDLAGESPMLLAPCEPVKPPLGKGGQEVELVAEQLRANGSRHLLRGERKLLE